MTLNRISDIEKGGMNVFNVSAFHLYFFFLTSHSHNYSMSVCVCTSFMHIRRTQVDVSLFYELPYRSTKHSKYGGTVYCSLFYF